MLIHDRAAREIAALKVSDPGTVLILRTGDGYELHGADAVLVSESLWLPMLTTPDGPCPAADYRLMVPAERLEEALVRLALAGRRVAIVERVTDAGAAPVAPAERVDVPEPGWLNRQLKWIKEDLKTWPSWMKDAVVPADELIADVDAYLAESISEIERERGTPKKD